MLGKWAHEGALSKNPRSSTLVYRTFQLRVPKVQISGPWLIFAGYEEFRFFNGVGVGDTKITKFPSLSLSYLGATLLWNVPMAVFTM